MNFKTTLNRAAALFATTSFMSSIVRADGYPGYVQPGYGQPFMPMPEQHTSLFGHFFFSSGAEFGTRLLCVIAGALIGGLIGTFLSDRYRKFRKLVLLGLVGVFALLGILAGNTLAFLISAVAAGAAMYYHFKDPTLSEYDEPIYGDAHPARYEEICTAGYVRVFDAATGQLGPSTAGIPLGFTL